MTLHVTADADIATLFTEGDPDAAQQAAQFLKSIAHRDRLKILCALLDKEHPVSEIEEKVGASQSAVSQHLTRLREDGILTSRRDGRRIYYSIADPTVLSLVHLLYDRFCGTGES